MIVTVDRLTKAIAIKLHIDESEALRLAERVLSYFGFTNVIIDNVLDSEDRKLFYRLHDAGLLNTYAERMVLPTGRTWRIFYWEILDKEIRDAIRKKRKPSDSTYSSLPPEYWSRMGAQA